MNVNVRANWPHFIKGQWHRQPWVLSITPDGFYLWIAPVGKYAALDRAISGENVPTYLNLLWKLGEAGERLEVELEWPEHLHRVLVWAREGDVLEVNEVGRQASRTAALLVSYLCNRDSASLIALNAWLHKRFGFGLSSSAPAPGGE